MAIRKKESSGSCVYDGRRWWANGRLAPSSVPRLLASSANAALGASRSLALGSGCGLSTHSPKTNNFPSFSFTFCGYPGCFLSKRGSCFDKTGTFVTLRFTLSTPRLRLALRSLSLTTPTRPLRRRCASTRTARLCLRLRLTFATASSRWRSFRACSAASVATLPPGGMIFIPHAFAALSLCNRGLAPSGSRFAQSFAPALCAAHLKICIVIDSLARRQGGCVYALLRPAASGVDGRCARYARSLSPCRPPARLRLSVALRLAWHSPMLASSLRSCSCALEPCHCASLVPDNARRVIHFESEVKKELAFLASPEKEKTGARNE